MTEVPKKIHELVERFEHNISAYKSPSYKEARLQQEFINPFFECLGWDVENKSGAAPQYQDVIFEDSIKIANATIPYEKKMIQRQIDVTNQQIDSLVYELYELTEDEIRIVEDAII